MFIYLIVNHETGKYYVGQHKGNNLKKYLQTKLSAARHHCGGNSHLFASMRKHLPYVWSIHALRSDIETREELDQTEKDFIKFLRSQNPEYGYNICRGGEGFTGPHTEETRAKQSRSIKKTLSTSNKRSEMAKTMKRLWANPEYRSKSIESRKKAWSNLERHIRQAEEAKKVWSVSEYRIKQAEGLKKVWSDPNYRDKISEARKRMWSDPNYRDKISEARKRMWSAKPGKECGLTPIIV